MKEVCPWNDNWGKVNVYSLGYLDLHITTFSYFLGKAFELWLHRGSEITIESRHNSFNIGVFFDPEYYDEEIHSVVGGYMHHHALIYDILNHLDSDSLNDVNSYLSIIINDIFSVLKNE